MIIPKYKSSPGAIKEFAQGNIWHDFLVELDGTIEQHRDALEVARDQVEVIAIQESIKAIRNFKEIPRVLYEKLEEAQELKDAEREGKKPNEYKPMI